MTGALLNTATVLIGGSAGLALKSRLPARAQQMVMKILGMVTLFVGGKMAFDAHKDMDPRGWVILVAALVVGIAFGSWLQIQRRLENLAQRAVGRFSSGDSWRIAEGFISTSLLFCVGPMTIVGSVQDGLTGNFEVIAVKSALDGVASMAFAAGLGWGVLLSAGSVLLVQGSITLGAQALSGFFTPPLVAQCCAAGGVLVCCIGITLMGIRKLPVADYLPAIVLAPLLARVVAALLYCHF